MNEINDWLDRNLHESIPEAVKGMSFNLYENAGSFSIELVGTDTFDEADPDWAGEEIWETKERKLEVKYSGDWNGFLEASKFAVVNYLKNGKKKNIFESVEGIGIGFVDGELEIIKRP